ncbi:spore coat protein JA [Bacillus ectoiniformans]|uniref:spore coat associated protein CotJA n=1 Tax=Bacillus ectoiniformans TaxID=1494429 RepID=UPI001959D4BD|nr:spore coat associated protein CotJA [Bacillus ectoiniformans]MBM7648018.1 spore coat protein JA [Bacillus ectoiniformans]
MAKPQWYRTYRPFISPTDPCPPIKIKRYSTPPNLFLGFQPPGMEQFPPMAALKKGTLWKYFYDPYFSLKELKRSESNENPHS